MSARDDVDLDLRRAFEVLAEASRAFAEAGLDLPRVFATLTPVKEREVVILGAPGADEGTIAAGVSHALSALRSQGVVAHDLALYVPPLAADGADWRRFPAIARLVDRGDPGNRTCDIGSMELYAASVIASDPFVVAAALQST